MKIEGSIGKFKVSSESKTVSEDELEQVQEYLKLCKGSSDIHKALSKSKNNEETRSLIKDNKKLLEKMRIFERETDWIFK